MRKIFASLLLIVIVTANALGQAQFAGYNSITCGDFMGGANTETYRALASQYVRGFMSAHNLFSGRKQVQMELPDTTIGLWLQKYCRENPLSNIRYGASVLLVELTGPLDLKKK